MYKSTIPKEEIYTINHKLHELSEQHMVSRLIERGLSFLYKLYTNT